MCATQAVKCGSTAAVRTSLCNKQPRVVRVGVEITDLAGPEPQDLVDMARRTLAARGESIRLIPSWRSGLFGVDAAGEVLLPGPEARLAPTTFEAWLTTQR